MTTDGAWNGYIRGKTLALYTMGNNMDVYYKSNPLTSGSWSRKKQFRPTSGNICCDSTSQMLSPEGRIVA